MVLTAISSRFPALCRSKKTARFTLSVTMWSVFQVAFLTAPSALAGPLQLHPKGEKLPTTQQGPFVTTGDGGILCIDAQQAHHSLDEGKTWTSTPLFQEPDKYKVSNERALLRTREGVIISAWMNMKELSHTPKFKWGGPPEEYAQWILPTYVCRSLDDGKTWEAPILLHRPWCGCIHSITQTKSGRIVLVGQTVIPEWRHATVMFVSDDQGKTWQTSNVLDYGVGRHDHAGSCEATILERKDGSLYELIRTESGFFFEAESTDDGLTWKNLKKSSVPSVTCCGQMARISDGRAVLLWNHPLRRDPTNGSRRDELSIAFSSDDGRTWTDRTVIASRPHQGGESIMASWVAYPYLYERHPGELWITTMQGNLRMKIKTDDITKDEVPLTDSVTFLGDSTVAHRPGAIKRVASDHIARELQKTGSALTVVNSGVGGNTTADGLQRLKLSIDKLKAKVLVVQFGINDAAVDVWKTPPATVPRLSQANFESNLKQIIELARAHNAHVILTTTNPIRWAPKIKELYGKPPYNVNAEDGFHTPVLARYNDSIRNLAKELNVPLVDLEKTYLQTAKDQGVSVDHFLLDGIHPNDAGQELAAKALWQAIQPLISTK